MAEKFFLTPANSVTPFCDTSNMCSINMATAVEELEVAGVPAGDDFAAMSPADLDGLLLAGAPDA